MDVYMPFIGMVFIWLLSSAIVSISREKQKSALLREGKYTSESYLETRKQMQRFTTDESNHLFNHIYNIVIVWYFFIVVFSLGAITTNFSSAPVIYLIDTIFFFFFAFFNFGASYYTQQIRRKMNSGLPELTFVAKALILIFRDFGTALIFLISYLRA